MPNDREKIQLFILGLRRTIYQYVGPQMEIYPTYSTMIDTTRMMEMREKEDDEHNKKQKRGFKGRPFNYGGSLGASKPPSQGQSALVVSSGLAQSLVSVS